MTTSAGLRLGPPKKAHPDSESAFRCMRSELLRQGYTQIGGRDFKPADGGPVVVLTKPSRFGGKLRPGKMGNRFRPVKNHGVVY